MSIRLQQFGFKESPYHRPNSKWVCGWAEDGNPCPVGPDGKGRCSADRQSNCTPRRGEEARGESPSRWYCTRPEPFGGPCECGPKPDGQCCHPTPTHAVCQPRLSLRSRRGRLTMWATLCTLGLLAMLLGGSWGSRFISSGPLTSTHQAAIGVAGVGGGADSCSSCHRDDPQRGGLFQPVADSACLSCHVAEAHHPTRSIGHIGATMTAPGRLEPVRAATDCVDCHREHRGADHSLVSMSDHACTDCHAALKPWLNVRGGLTDDAITSFATNHPEFDLIRHQRVDPTLLRFEHHVHMSPETRGMQEQLAEWLGEYKPGDPPLPVQRIAGGSLQLACVACHEPDAAGQAMQPISFEHHCQRCHDLGSKAGEAVVHGAGISYFIASMAAKLATQPPEPAKAAPGASGGPPRASGPPGRSGPPSAAPAPAPAPSGPPGRPGGPLRGGPPASPAATTTATTQNAGLTFKSEADLIVMLSQRISGKTTEISRPLSYVCAKCHGPTSDVTKIEPPQVPDRWMPASVFSHAAHRFTSCIECHHDAALTTAPPSPAAIDEAVNAGAPKWTSRTKEVMIPSIGKCRQCHGTQDTVAVTSLANTSGPARQDCVTCHRYHASRPMPPKPTFLQAAGK